MDTYLIKTSLKLDVISSKISDSKFLLIDKYVLLTFVLYYNLTELWNLRIEVCRGYEKNKAYEVLPYLSRKKALKCKAFLV